MRVLVFTWKGDARNARLATRTIPAGWSVAWVVDEGDRWMVPPDGVELLVRPFERGPNLAGAGAVVGVAGVLEEQAAKFGRVGKIDSDCLLVDPSFLLAGDVAGMAHKSHPCAAYGLAYALTHKAAQRAAEGVKRAIGLGALVGGEDVWVTSCAAGGVDGRVRIGSFWETPHRGEPIPKGCLAIHCGGVRYATRHGDAVTREMERLGESGGLWRRGV